MMAEITANVIKPTYINNPRTQRLLILLQIISIEISRPTKCMPLKFTCHTWG